MARRGERRVVSATWRLSVDDAMLRWRILGILHENNDEAVAGPVRHRAVAQAALAATGARTAVTEDDAIHCITSHTVAHRVCIPNGWLGGQSRKVTHGNRLDC